MIELGTILTVLNIAEKARGLYSAFSGTSSGNQLTKLLSDLEHTKSEVRRLSDRLLWAPNITQAVSCIQHEPLSHFNLEEQVQRLTSIGETLKQDILLTEVSRTPEKLRKAFDKDPFELLIDPRPIHRAKRPNDPDLVPVMFSDNDTDFVGWQKIALLPILFDCKLEAKISEPTLPAHTRRSETPAVSKRKRSEDESPRADTIEIDVVLKNTSFKQLVAWATTALTISFEEAENVGVKAKLILKDDEVAVRIDPDDVKFWFRKRIWEFARIAYPTRGNHNELTGFTVSVDSGPKVDDEANNFSIYIPSSDRMGQIKFEQWALTKAQDWEFYVKLRIMRLNG